jgi:uncharacterized protein YggE
LVAGAVAGALAVGVVAAVDDGPQSAGAQETTTTTIAGGGAGGNGTKPVRTVTVTGEGTASGTPDTAIAQLGVQTQAAKANDALNQANAKAQELLDALKFGGVDKKDITTTNVSLYPQYANDGHTITGYQAANTVMVKMRDVAKAGTIIDAAAGVVGDEITLQGVSFMIDDTGALRSAARADAVAKAKAQADQLAGAAGLKVGKVISLNEGSASPVPPMPYLQADAAAGAPAASVPLEPGQQQLDVYVTVVYELTE